MLLLPVHMSIPLPKAPIHQLFQRSILGRFRGVGLDEVVGFSLKLLVEAENVIGSDDGLAKVLGVSIEELFKE